MNHSSLKSDIWLILVTLFAALGWVFSTEALVGMTPLFFIGTRFLLAGFVLSGFGWGALQRLSSRDWRHALLTGAVMGLALSCWIMGLSLADNMGIGAFIASLAVVFIPIVGKLMFGSTTSRSTWVAVGVSLLGLLWFGQQMTALQLLGCGLIFSALLVSRWRVLFRRSVVPSKGVT